MGKKNDDGLSADAALAVEDTPERQAERNSYFGGDVDPIDSEELDHLDDGSDLDYEPPADDDDGDGKKEDDDADEADKDPDEGDSDDDAESDDDADDAEADAEDADEADAEEDGDDEDEADPEPKAKGIPKHRFDQVNERAKAAEAENARLKAQIEAGKPPEEEDEPYDVRAGEKEYMDLLLDGDTESALAKREEIDAAKEAKWKSESQQETRTNIDTDAEHSELMGLSQEAEGMFSVFDPDHEDYNQDMLNKVMVFMRGYESTGEMSRGDAFVAGLADVVEMFDLMPPEEDEAEEEDGKPKPTGKKKTDTKRKKKLAEGAHVPVGGEGKGSADVGAAVPDIETMTDEEIDALPEKTLARLRGDFV